MNVEQIVRGLGLIAAVALIGWGLAGGGLSSADRGKLTDSITATNQIADHHSNSANSNPSKIAGVSGSGFYTLTQIPIKDIQLGSRVPAHNPEVTTDQRRQFQEPRWDRWMKLSVQMVKADGSLLEIELLRSEEWVIEQLIVQTQAPQTECFWRLEDESTSVHADTDRSVVLDANGQQPADAAAFCEETLGGPTDPSEKRDVEGIPASFVPLRPVYAHLLDTVTNAWLSGDVVVGLSVYLHLPELGISGLGRLVDLEPAPFVRPGPGQVVTATFKHASAEVLDLVLTNEPPTILSPSPSTLSSSPTDSIGVTANHPFWSVDRAEFVQAGELRIGERLQTLAGDTVWVQQKLPRPGPTPVYNLEVQDEHVYYVGANGVLAHNAYAPVKGVRVASTLGKEFDGFQIQRILQKGEKISDIIEESKRLTFEVGEVAVVRLKDGRRAIVTGGRDGIDFGTGNIDRIYGHSHPYHLPPTGPSGDDFNALRVLNDPFSHLLEHGQLYRFEAGGLIENVTGAIR